MDDKWIKSDKLADIVKAINDLTKTDVLVGIPESKAAREDSPGITNAEIGYIQENGSPAQNIPARSFLIPGVADARGKYQQHLVKAANLALDGNKRDAIKQLDAAGIIAEQGAKAKINSGDFAPLSDATLRARAAKGRKGAAEELRRRSEGMDPGTDLAKPLIDTGQLRNSITHVIRETK